MSSINEIHTDRASARTVIDYDEPTVGSRDAINWVFSDLPSKAKSYVLSLFPILQWIYRYNLTWLTGDLIAGITVGVVVVPQSMSYAQIAGLKPEYGLYSSFVGVMIYALFATSKDVTIGPVAVMSAEVYKVVSRVIEKMPGTSFDKDGPMIAGTLALLCGGITAGIGFLRLGFILEYIAMPCVLGFMSGSAFTIIVGQIPSLMGIDKLFNTRAESYKVVINSLKNLKHSNLNAAFGLVCLFLLFVFKYLFEYLGRRYPRRKRLFFFLATLRTGVIIIFATLISWGICHGHYNKKKDKYPISILRTVPSGLKQVGVHPVHLDVVQNLATELPIATVILLLEHIAIAKSFGRLNNYRINPNQELIAIGATNLINHFFLAYPATGSFSRTAIKSKSGVRTPLAGIFTGVCVLVAIYGLTDAFFWISKASLSAVIIHAVVDLISSWRSTWSFWLVSPVECIIFLVDIILCVFVSIEAGIYFSVAASLVFLLLRISFPVGQFLGKIEYSKINNPALIQSSTDITGKKILYGSVSEDVKDVESQPGASTAESVEVERVRPEKSESSGQASVHAPHAPTAAEGTGVKWVPLSHSGINPNVEVLPPPPGVFVYQFNESLLYPNVSRQLDHLVVHIRKHCRPDVDTSQTVRLGDRPWNDHGPRHRKVDPNYVDPRPYLRAVVIDLSATPNIDLTAVSQLADCKDELSRFANREVEFHFAGLISPWTRRALINGFAATVEENPRTHQVYAARRENFDIEAQNNKDDEPESDLAAVLSTSTLFFHLDIPDLS